MCSHSRKSRNLTQLEDTWSKSSIIANLHIISQMNVMKHTSNDHTESLLFTSKGYSNVAYVAIL